MSKDATGDWTDLKFSPDGKYIMIVTNSNVLRLVDSFEGKDEIKLTGHNNKGQALEASFSPDSKYVFCGWLGVCVCGM